MKTFVSTPMFATTVSYALSFVCELSDILSICAQDAIHEYPRLHTRNSPPDCKVAPENPLDGVVIHCLQVVCMMLTTSARCTIHRLFCATT